MSQAWKNYDEHADWLRLAREVLGCKALWDEDLNDIPELRRQVAFDLAAIDQKGMLAALG
jgi:mannitol-1-phosphate/altronate dehydrogenase